MEQLANMECVACKAGDPALTDAEIAALQPQIPGWQIIEVDSIKRLQRVFTFKNFVDALNFTHKVGELAEKQGHHPALLTEWGKVTVQWWTHSIGGLHRNDVIMAAKTDELA